MLQTATIEPATLELLKRLMQQPVLESFALAGGTNLSLRYGHRLSIDLDLFTNESFSVTDVFDELVTYFPGVVKTDEGKNTLSLMIEGSKLIFWLIAIHY